MRLQTEASGAWLFPAPVPIDLAGEPFRACEFRMVDVWNLERAIEAALRHPYVGFEDRIAPSLECRPFAAKYDAVSPLWDASSQWPPRLGSDAFSKGLATPGVLATFLRIVLRHSDLPVSREDADAMVEALDANEWDALHSIAWGRATRQEAGPGRAMEWKSAIVFLVGDMGLTPREIEELYVTQFFALISPKSAYEVDLPDFPPTVGPEDAARYGRMKEELDAWSKAEKAKFDEARATARGVRPR